MVPASTQKLLTATAALEVLDPTGRFRTTAVAAAAPAGGVVAGDLTLVGGGDPLLATADYAARFRRQPQLFTDLDRLAAAIADGRCAPHRRGRRRRRAPLRHRAATWRAGRSGTSTRTQSGRCRRLAVNDGFATYPTADDPRRRARRRPPEPAVDAAAVLTRLLEARGVDVVGAPRAGAAPDGRGRGRGGRVGAARSTSSRQLLRESDNNTGRAAAEGDRTHDAATATTAGGAAVVADVVARPRDGRRSIDGSGLSLDDRVTCQLLVDVLTGPAPARRSTTSSRSPASRARWPSASWAPRCEGVLRAKTGSLTSVASLAGVVEDDDPPLTFAFVVNVPTRRRPSPSGVAALQQQVGEVLASWPRVPDVVVLGPRVEDGLT